VYILDISITCVPFYPYTLCFPIQTKLKHQNGENPKMLVVPMYPKYPIKHQTVVLLHSIPHQTDSMDQANEDKKAEYQTFSHVTVFHAPFFAFICLLLVHI
jgi:hypothetical protein